MSRLTIRSAEIGRRLDTFLVTAVSTILAIRLGLFLSDYPSVGGSTLHIAHMLYGGLLMMVVIIAMLGLLNERVKHLAAFFGGIGFGFFIDELGKFITRDNDYFFQPTAALIYLIFIAIYLIGQAVLVRRGLTQREYLINALEYLKEAGIGDLDQTEQRRALAYLKLADPKDPLVKPLHKLLQTLKAVETPPPSRLKRLWQLPRQSYLKLVKHRWFQSGLIGIFIVLGLASSVVLIGIVFGISSNLLTEQPGSVVNRITDRIDDLSVISWISLLSAMVAGSLVVAGSIRLRHSRLAAYRTYETALLISLFVTQVFVFVKIEFIGSITLAINLLLLVAIRAMIQQEQRLKG